MSMGWGIFLMGRKVQGAQTPDTRAVIWSAGWPRAISHHLPVLAVPFWEESWMFPGVWWRGWGVADRGPNSRHSHRSYSCRRGQGTSLWFLKDDVSVSAVLLIAGLP